MTRLARVLALAFLAATAAADTITVKGQVFDQVHVTETSSLYLVSDPETGEVKTYSKSEVKPEDVVIDPDPLARAALYDAWKQARDAKQKPDSTTAQPGPAKASNTSDEAQPPRAVLRSKAKESDEQQAADDKEWDPARAAQQQALREQIAANQAAARERSAARNRAKTQQRGLTSQDAQSAYQAQRNQQTQQGSGYTVPGVQY